MSPAASNGRIYDMHCHLHEYSEQEIEEILSAIDVVIVAVSEDLESFKRTLSLAERFDGRIIPCAGFHPWSLREKPLSEAREILRMAERIGVKCVGEVGLDKKFMPSETFPKQIEVASMFLDLARELDAYVTLHAPNAWRETLDLAVRHGVRKAMFHWYTGPLNLIEDIVRAGYYISINPAIKIQEKHKRVASHAPLEWIVFESDGPYNYRGLRLDPRMIPEAINIVASIRRADPDQVGELARRNSERLLGFID